MIRKQPHVTSPSVSPCLGLRAKEQNDRRLLESLQKRSKYVEDGNAEATEVSITDAKS